MRGCNLNNICLHNVSQRQLFKYHANMYINIYNKADKRGLSSWHPRKVGKKKIVEAKTKKRNQCGDYNKQVILRTGIHRFCPNLLLVIRFSNISVSAGLWWVRAEITNGPFSVLVEEIHHGSLWISCRLFLQENVKITKSFCFGACISV